ncbi:MAG: hypothetical protein ACYTGU_18445 [Planctomycetota bacterium]
MKRNRFLLFVTSLCLALGFVLTSATVASADQNPVSTCEAQCDALGDLGLNHGQCVSFCASCLNNGNTQANCTCNFFQFLGILEQVFGNFGQCIKAFK